MSTAELTPLLRMMERSLIVVGGILAIYLGYKLFVLGIDKSQGEASAFGVSLKNFGPGLFFAALGAVVLVTTMNAAIRLGPAATAPERDLVKAEEAAASGSVHFLGLEDPSRVDNEWTPTSFYLETRDLLRRLDKGEKVEELANLRSLLKNKLDAITMDAKEYARFQELTQKLPLSDEEQRELIVLEKKLFP